MESFKNLKCPSFEDLWLLLALGDGHSLNGNILDDASLEVMLRIEKTMQRLKAMGDDDRRYLWMEIEAPPPDEDEEENGFWEEEPDPNGHLWYQLLTAHYKGFHYLLMSNRHWRFVDLRSAHHVGAERDPENDFYCNMVEPLTRLETYVTALVDAIVDDPEAYNDYVERHLPYNKRVGTIQRSTLCSICPSYHAVEHPQRYLQMLEAMMAMEPKRFEVMTLRLYMHYWRVAYVAYTTMDRYDPDDPEVFKGMTDEEVFSYSSKGREVEGYDLDSEEDYLKWEKENSSYHCHDVAYARIHLWPHRNEEGLWFFSLAYNVVGYFQDVLNILTVFYQMGVGIDIRCFAEHAIAKLKEEDEVTITPQPNKYREEMSLPYPDAAVTEEMVQEIIKNTRWMPQAKVRVV